jgi:ABC-2 type transport system ATP-binding protein
MEHAIEVVDLHKRYGRSVALVDVSFSVRPGEVFCLLGPNGAGKTTTTEILEGYRDRSGGEVRVLGHDPQRHERALRERVGIVLQECGIQEELTVAEAIDLYAGLSRRRLPTTAVLELVELDARTTDRIKHLSGGQRRRLDVALALVGDPDVVFLDEPTTGFDPAARRASWSMIRNLCSLGKTVLLTTHFMDEAEALADRIAVIVGGRIVAEGTPATLGDRHLAPTVVSCTLPQSAVPPNLPTAVASLDGTTLRAVCTDPAVALHELTSWSLATGTPLVGLSVNPPSLEDVYLALTATAADTRHQETVR